MEATRAFIAEFKNISDTTSLFKPMDQGVIAALNLYPPNVDKMVGSCQC